MNDTEIFSYVEDAFPLVSEEVLLLVGVVFNPAGALDVQYTATVRNEEDDTYWRVDHYHDDNIVVTEYSQTAKVVLETVGEEEVNAY